MTMTPLVTTQWLFDNLGNADLTIIDATWFMPGVARDAKAEFVAAHIPGAVFFPIDGICDHASPLPHMLSAPADFAVAARRLGVNPASHVVIYDAQGLIAAARVWWNFRVMGHTFVSVLDGGLAKWTAEARPIEIGWNEVVHGEFKSRPRADLIVNLEAVNTALTTGSAQIIDARPAARFAGTEPEPRISLRSGHMPGALNLPWQSLLSADGTLVTAGALETIFRAAGVNLNAPIITSCGSGITASGLALALASLGRDDVAVYDGSWTEWGGRADTAVVTGKS